MSTKIWNASNTSRVLLGRTVKPGRCVVTGESVSSLHKLATGIESRNVMVGDSAPYGKPPRAVADARLVNGKGEVEGPRRIAPKAAHGQDSVESSAEPKNLDLFPKTTPEQKAPGELTSSLQATDDVSLLKKKAKKVE